MDLPDATTGQDARTDYPVTQVRAKTTEEVSVVPAQPFTTSTSEIRGMGPMCKTRASQRMAERALNGFSVSPEARRALVERAEQIVATGSERAAIAAMQVLIKADLCDIRALDAATRAEQRAETPPPTPSLTVHINGVGQVNANDPAALAGLSLPQLEEIQTAIRAYKALEMGGGSPGG